MKEKKPKKPKKRRTKWDTQTIRKPRKGTKAEAILTLTTSTSATPPQIADQINVSNQCVHDTLKRYGIDANTTETFKNHRADILAAAQARDLKLYQELDDDERKRLISKRGMVDFGILYDKERLERGQSTGNIHQITDLIKRVQTQDSQEEEE